MRIAVDLSPLSRPFPLGVKKVAQSALAALEARDDLEILGITPPAGTSLLRWRQSGLAQAARKCRADLLHSWTSAFPLFTGIPVSQTVHEAPWVHGAKENAGPGHRLWARLGRARAALVITPSARVARDLGGHGKLRVVPWGVDAAFSSLPDATDAELEASLEGTVPARGHDRFALVLGGTRPKKRLDLVLKAAARTSSGPLRVVATGPSTPYAESLAAEFPHLSLAGVVDERLVPALLRRASCLAVLSRSEGFALPVLEAMATGTPVVVAEGTVQAATAGDFGVRVNALDTDAVAEALNAALAESTSTDASSELTSRLRAAEAFAAAHTWDAVAESLSRHWRSAL